MCLLTNTLKDCIIKLQITRINDVAPTNEIGVLD